MNFLKPVNNIILYKVFAELFISNTCFRQKLLRKCQISRGLIENHVNHINSCQFPILEFTEPIFTILV